MPSPWMHYATPEIPNPIHSSGDRKTFLMKFICPKTWRHPEVWLYPSPYGVEYGSLGNSWDPGWGAELSFLIDNLAFVETESLWDEDLQDFSQIPRVIVNGESFDENETWSELLNSLFADDPM